MKSIKDITIEDVHNLFDIIILSRGKEYFQKGNVESVEMINSHSISGIVVGTIEYRVSVTIDSNDYIECKCSCPCDFYCKHIVALLLEWLSVKKNYSKSLTSDEPLKKQDLSTILSKKTKEELIALSLEFIQKYPDLKSLVFIDHKELTSKIRNLFKKFWEWNEISELIHKLETLLEGIRRNKDSWNIDLLDEMKTCSEIMIKGQNNVHDEGDLGLFFEDWFLIYGEIFSFTKPKINEKINFIQYILKLSENDDYSFENSFEKALIGMCENKEDIELIKNYYIHNNYKYEEEDDYKEFYLELFDKIGLDDEYLKFAKKQGYSSNIIDKLISLNRLEEALEECEKYNDNNPFYYIKNKKIEILKKLGKKEELKKELFDEIKQTHDIKYLLMLKQESKKDEWKKYLELIISYAKQKNQNSFLSRLYYNEKDYKNAYEYSKNLTDNTYLENLAKKLSFEHPNLACEILRKLCLEFIKKGSGWPYKKVGELLETIKKIDKKNDFFKKTKNEIIHNHKKKYSLMEIIEKI
ncbi:MAG: SWIM zinc finger family protein [Candidatus Woesearchaeota archaeon]